MDFGNFAGLSGLGPQRCPVCSATTGLLRCGGCRVVTYCSTAHQTTDRPEHKAACTAIKKTREMLEREEAALRAHPGDVLMPADVFSTRVGSFWGIWGTRDYMRARSAAASALLKVDTVLAVKKALEHFTDMMRLCRSDNLGVRDFVPNLMLRLGREQECYDFLKWWTIPNEHYDWGDTSLPYLNIRNADPFESIAGFVADSDAQVELSHLVTLTLLKVRLRRDLQAHRPASPIDEIFGMSDSLEPDWPTGDLVRSRLETLDADGVSDLIEALGEQISTLCRAVHKSNPHVWDLLVSEDADGPPVEAYALGSAEHASFVVSLSRRAWEESEDAILMIDDESGSLVQEYRGPSNTATRPEDGGSRPQKLELRRGTGAVFPSRFEPPTPTCTPAEIFPANAFGRNRTVRFGALDNSKQILIYTDGACPDNGQPNARAGWAVVCDYRPESGRLEDKGPFGDNSVLTSNRAELRASIAALRLSDWRAEGFNNIVIATDSTYVVDGITGWVQGWIRNGWMTRVGGEVKNRDLWELLLGEVERWHELGVRVSFWRIPREHNMMADEAAKDAATRPAEPEFTDAFLDASEAVIPFTPITPITTSPTATSAGTTTRRILTLCFDYEELFDDIYKPLISKLTSKATMERATDASSALAILAREPPPSVILVADAGLARNRTVWERVIDLLRAGTTVVLAGCFSSMVNGPEFDRFFARAGLPWKQSAYQRSTTSLRRDVVGARLAGRLPAAYSQKSVFVKGADPSAWWYTAQDAPDQAAVVFVTVGKGKLGYVGDVNGEDGSEAVVMAMCGLLE